MEHNDQLDDPNPNQNQNPPDHAAVYGGDDDLISEESSDSDDEEIDVLHEEIDSLSGDHDDEVTVAVAAPLPLTTTSAAPVANSSVVVYEEKRKPLPISDERKLFQRLWTDEDEIELLQGFLEYTTQRGGSSAHHHDTTAFYDQIKDKLQLDFNKNQLVEKLRRLKKKYRNVIAKVSAGKEVVFKTPHDQVTFEISSKIWSNVGNVSGSGSGNANVNVTPGSVIGFDDDDMNQSVNVGGNVNANVISFSSSPALKLCDLNNNGVEFSPNSYEKKVPRPRKRSRSGGNVPVKIEDNLQHLQQHSQQHSQQSYHQPLNYPPQVSNSQPAVEATPSIPSLVEETVKSCISPLFKELINNAMNGPGGSRGFGGVTLNPMPFGFGGGSGNFGCGDMTDEKWRKQHILELEVYSKRLELVQDEIKAQLEELRSMGS